MKSYIMKFKKLKLKWLCVVCVLIFCTGCISRGEKYLEWSLEEAQNYSDFNICIPAYVPDGLRWTQLKDKEIKLLTPVDFPGSHIYLEQVDNDNVNPKVTIIESFAPGRFGDPDKDENTNYRAALRGLIAWSTSWTEVDDLENLVDSDYEIYSDDNNIEYRITTISLPEEIKSLSISWKNDEVQYVVRSSISYEEVLKIINSISECVP